MKKRVLAIVLSLSMISVLIPSFSFADVAGALSDNDIEDETKYMDDVLFEEGDDDCFTTESDYFEDEDVDPGIEEDANIDEEIISENLELGLPEDEELDDPVGENESDETIDENDELFIEEPEEDEDNEENYIDSEDLNEYTDEDISAGEESLEASGAKLTCPSKVTVGVNRINVFKLSHKGKAKKYSIKVANESICTAKFDWEDKSYIHIEGKKTGSTYITVKLKGGLLGLFTYDTKNIKVNVPKMTSSSSSVKVPKGVAKKVSFSYSNCPDSVKVIWRGSNTSKYSATWGKWSKKNISLTIKGRAVGSGIITVYLINKSTNTIVAEKTIKVCIANPPTIKVSTSKVSMLTGKSSTVKISYGNLSEKSKITVGYTNSSAFSLSWGSSSGQTKVMNITGKKKGKGTVNVYLKSVADNTVLAKTSFTVNVSQNPEITVSSSSANIKTSENKTINCKVLGVSGVYKVKATSSNCSCVIATVGKRSNNSVPVILSGINAGSAKVTVSVKNTSGKVLASNAISVTSVAGGTPCINLTTSKPSVEVGCTTQITAKPVNMPAGSRRYTISCSDTSICKVNVEAKANPVITIKGLRTGTSTLTIKFIKDSTGDLLASKTVTVTVKAKDEFKRLAYAFYNPSNTASLKTCQLIFGKTEHAKLMYNSKYNKKAHGNCYGMSATSSIIYAPNSVYASSFGRSNVRSLALNDKNSAWGITLRQWIKANHLTQFSQGFVYECREEAKGNYSGLVNLIKNGAKDKRPVILIFDGDYAHAVVGYGFETVSSTQDRILVYDNNCPDTVKYLYLTKSNGAYTGKWECNCSYYYSSKSHNLDYVTYDNYKSRWDQRGTLEYENVYKDSSNYGYNESVANYNFVAINSGNVIISDVEDNEIARIEDGQLKTESDDITLITPLSESEDEDVSNDVFLYLPIDVYEFRNEDNNIDDFSVAIANLELSTSVETSGDEVTLCADDSSDFASAVLEAEDGEEYSISLGSSREGEPETMEWDGVGTGETVSMMLNAGNLEMCNMEGSNVSISDENMGESIDTMYSIVAITDGNGVITPSGNDLVAEGTDQKYEFVPSDGYRIKAVTIDGADKGKISEYTFSNVHDHHSVMVTFEESDDISDADIINKSNATYTGKNVTGNIQLKIGEKVLEEDVDYKVEYENNKNVGTAKVKFIGIGDFTGSRVLTFKINPKGTYIKTLKRARKAFTVKWNRQSAKMSTSRITGYQIRYSRYSSMSNAKIRTVKGYRNTSKKIRKLKKKKRYYVQVRTYKTVNGTRYYSSWSKKKYVKTR